MLVYRIHIYYSFFYFSTTKAQLSFSFFVAGTRNLRKFWNTRTEFPLRTFVVWRNCCSATVANLATTNNDIAMGGLCGFEVG